MYIPHYINAALPKTMSRTQQVRHTVKSFRIFSLLTTIAAVMCDWTQLNYYTQLSLNDTFWGGVSVSIIVVLGLDVSMFFLGTVLNQYRKATGTTKGNFRFIGIGLLVTFLIAYVVYLLMAIPVLSQQASDGDVPFYGRLLIPIASSALAFFTSVGWDPKGEQIQRLLDEKLKISSDIKKASTLAYLPCHADIDLKLLDLIHIAYTDGIQKSDLYRYDSQTFNIIISGETGELLCKYDES